MSKAQQINIKSLSLDLKNFRTTPQKSEIDAIQAMISIKPERFHALIDSLIEDGYLHTENIIVLKEGKNMTVKEGNRRIAILKLLHGQYDPTSFNLPHNITTKIKQITDSWKANNALVPCIVYDKKDIDKVDKIITLAHGKGEKASRDQWTSVARARHNRDVNKANELGLDLLEKYLQKGMNLTNQQRDRWAGDYPMTVLDEAIRKIYPRFQIQSVADLSKNYPTIIYRSELEELLRDIGLEIVKFETIRNTQQDFANTYNILPQAVPVVPLTTVPKNTQPSITTKNSTSSNKKSTPPPSNISNITSSNSTANTTATITLAKTTKKALSTNDPKHVSALLRKFSPRGTNRQKVVALKDELRKLKIKDNPIAFCFLLRSMFELSAKAYCTDHSISLQKNGKDKKLVEVLRDITNHLTNHNSNIAMTKTLHGAMAEMGRNDGILSVTSMNQLVHNPNFSVIPNDICILFGNIYPLLEAMN